MDGQRNQLILLIDHCKESQVID